MNTIMQKHKRYRNV